MSILVANILRIHQHRAYHTQGRQSMFQRMVVWQRLELAARRGSGLGLLRINLVYDCYLANILNFQDAR